MPVKAGRYTIVGKLFESKGSNDRFAGLYEAGEETAFKWNFIIVP